MVLDELYSPTGAQPADGDSTAATTHCSRR